MYKILIADDEPHLLEGIKEFVDWSSLNSEVVFTASNGNDIVNYLSRYSADILITDIRMPGLDGTEIAQWIYENKIRTKVIFLTAYQDFQYMKKGIEYGIGAYVLKDDYIDELEPTIKRVISDINNKGRLLNEYVGKFIMKNATENDKNEFSSLWQQAEYICAILKLKNDGRIAVSEVITGIIEKHFKASNVIINSFSRFEYMCLMPGDCMDIENRFNRIIEEIQKSCGFDARVGISNSGSDILMLHEHLLEADDSVNNIETGILRYRDIKSNRLTEKVCSIIEKNYDKRVSLSMLANELNVSASYLSRKFSDEKGCTITDYINKFRMEKAVKLIENTDMLVYEIAEKVGIVDPAHFTNVFKKYIGVSPQKYKKEFLS